VKSPKFCECGKQINQYASKCKKCHDAQMDKIHAESQAIVNTGKCPQCGSALTYNSAILGWFQCVQYGNWKLSKGDVNKPDCGFQCFVR